MKKFIFSLIVILLVPILALSQTEKDQKLIIRNQNTPTSSSSSSKITTTELFQKQEIRQESQRPTTQTYTPTTYLPRYPYRVSRWNRWGAPLNHYVYDEFYFTDRWGYRTPARIYHLRDGKTDTVVGKKNKVRIGVNFSTRNEVGAWFTLGREVYFKGGFNKIISSDKSQFYNHPDVNFYNANTIWNDRQLDDVIKGWSTYLGVGREFKNFGVNISLGFGKEENNYQFFDEYYVLSNNGKYSFRNFVDDYLTMSVGITHDYKFLSINADFDPIRKTFYFGAGFNF